MSVHSHEIAPNSAVQKEDALVVNIAVTPEEKQAIYRFRYRIYANEISYHGTGIDHERQLLYDEMDEWAILLYTTSNTEIIGTLRINIGSINDFPLELAQSLQMSQFQKFMQNSTRQSFAYVSKGMIASSYRGSGVHFILAQKSYEFFQENRVQFGFLICNHYLIPFHEHHGYQRYGQSFTDSVVGLVAPLALLVEDVHHLRAVHSPFVAMAQRKTNKQVSNWFHAEFPEAAKAINSQLISKSALWTLLSARLGSAPHRFIPLLNGLSAAQAKLFLHTCGIIVSYRAQEQIMTRGDRCHEVTILLSGAVTTVENADDPPVLPGRHFGGVGLVERTGYPISMQTTTDSELLLLTHKAFPKFSRQHPEIAAKIVQNLQNSQVGG